MVNVILATTLPEAKQDIQDARLAHDAHPQRDPAKVPGRPTRAGAAAPAGGPAGGANKGQVHSAPGTPRLPGRPCRHPDSGQGGLFCSCRRFQGGATWGPNVQLFLAHPKAHRDRRMQLNVHRRRGVCRGERAPGARAGRGDCLCGPLALFGAPAPPRQHARVRPGQPARRWQPPGRLGWTRGPLWRLNLYVKA